MKRLTKHRTKKPKYKEVGSDKKTTCRGEKSFAPTNDDSHTTCRDKKSFATTIPAGKPLLICKNLSAGYDGKAVLSNTSFVVNTGDYLCIVGENGSGKSTLMKVLLRLQSPLSGEISFSNDLSINEIGYLPQQTAIQKDFPASVREIVLSGCLNRTGLRPFYTKAEKQMAERNMISIGITDLSDRCYRELSGGQQQRTLLARALCATGKLLLLDEPAAGLDPVVASDMYELIARLNTIGITIIMISHNISSVVNYATHILHLGGGSIIFYGTKEQYLLSTVGKVYTNSGDTAV